MGLPKLNGGNVGSLVKLGFETNSPMNRYNLNKSDNRSQAKYICCGGHFTFSGDQECPLSVGSMVNSQGFDGSVIHS